MLSARDLLYFEDTQAKSEWTEYSFCILYAKDNQKRGGVAIIISVKIDFKSKLVIQDKNVTVL